MGPWLLRCTTVRAVVAILALFLAACDPPQNTADKNAKAASDKNTTDPQWVVEKSPHSDVAVVFVHGIFGDTLGTWAGPTKSFFQYVQEIPDVGNKLDLFAFGYPSNMVKPGSFRIQEAANVLNESLKYNHVTDRTSIVFVAHSMGGLVVLQELLTHRELLNKVPLIILYSTPQEGAQITTIARKVANNPALEEMLPADRNSFLMQLNDQWKTLPSRPPIICAYEKLPTDGVVVVPWSSATRFCDGTATPVEANHIDIVKPHTWVTRGGNQCAESVCGGETAKAKTSLARFHREGWSAYIHAL